MDIIRFRGGLGNQMFQYAFLEALRFRGRDVKGSLGYYDRHPDTMGFCLTEVFHGVEIDYLPEEEFQGIDDRWRTVKSDKKMLAHWEQCVEDRFFWVETDFGQFRPEVFRTRNCVFVGYWQTEKYFKDIRALLIDKFSFFLPEEKLRQLGMAVVRGNYIGVHVRRGDYLEHPQIYGNICSLEYYRKAIEYIQKRVQKCRMIFFSDDIAWVKEAFSDKDAIYCEASMFAKYADWYDMYLMTMCRHLILANSSFSWWGAWLNQNAGKIVVSPAKWCNIAPMQDIHCADWIRI